MTHGPVNANQITGIYKITTCMNIMFIYMDIVLGQGAVEPLVSLISVVKIITCSRFIL